MDIRSDGALSDALGPFYAERLELNAKEFVAMLSAFPPKEQRRICWLAGTEDGGGMSPKEERKVLANLKEVGGNLADRCSRSIHTGSREADQSNSDPPAAAQPQN